MSKNIVEPGDFDSLVNHGMPENSQIGINNQKITFIQKSDTWDDSEKYQQMTFESIGVDFDINDNTDSFLRISIGARSNDPEDEPDIAPFWSVDGPEEIVRIFNEVAKRFGWKCRWRLEKVYPDPEDPSK